MTHQFYTYSCSSICGCSSSSIYCMYIIKTGGWHQEYFYMEFQGVTEKWHFYFFIIWPNKPLRRKLYRIVCLGNRWKPDNASLAEWRLRMTVDHVSYELTSGVRLPQLALKIWQFRIAAIPGGCNPPALLRAFVGSSPTAVTKNNDIGIQPSYCSNNAWWRLNRLWILLVRDRDIPPIDWLGDH